MEKNEKLCPGCQVGFEQYILDKQSPECPYLSAHNGKFCPFYKRIEDTQKEPDELS